ncbi:hypothetical protein Patl1_29300 [Pistacia atlantica]|uniref:Uncharacterized protein n=1 Tax=Pistacia atlantica TaxID=434234 RepID=A0ACC1BFA2_9ROSI|nr:hypothetical protein Patl1_29300 [Pistacia atlantica]
MLKGEPAEQSTDLRYKGIQQRLGTKPVSKICISAKAGSTMLPCKEPKDKEDYNNGGNDGDDRRKLLWHTGEGKVPLVSQSGIHQLHIFIFMLAVFHVLYSVLTIGLAKAKMKKWKGWELETSSLEYQFTNDPSRFRLAHQTSFVRGHTGFFTAPGLRWIVAFFRQFFYSVTKVDYLTMRHGFIKAHLAPNSKFNFHKYIKRSMEDDFKVVVGISLPLWTCCIVFQLLNVYGWYTISWASFIPLVIFLIVGAKLEIIIMEMAQQIQDRGTVVKGAPVVEPSNSFFWFNCPDLILFLLHFTLFQVLLLPCYAFALERVPDGLLSMDMALQILCSYITFPLYALVTQMGSHMKKAIFEEQTAMALKKWQKAARERKKLTKATGMDIPSSFKREENNTPSHGPSPLQFLHKYKSNTAMDLESAPSSPRSSYNYNSETELLEIEGPAPLVSSDDHHEPRKYNNQQTFAKTDCGDFSFVKP